MILSIPLFVSSFAGINNSFNKTNHSLWHLFWTIAGPIFIVSAEFFMLENYYGNMVYDKPWIFILACGLIHTQGTVRLIICSVTRMRQIIIGPEYLGPLTTAAMIAVG